MPSNSLSTSSKYAFSFISIAVPMIYLPLVQHCSAEPLLPGLSNRTFQILFILHYSSFAGEVKDYSRTHSALIMHTCCSKACAGDALIRSWDPCGQVIP